MDMCLDPFIPGGGYSPLEGDGGPAWKSALADALRWLGLRDVVGSIIGLPSSGSHNAASCRFSTPLSITFTGSTLAGSTLLLEVLLCSLLGFFFTADPSFSGARVRASGGGVDVCDELL